MDNLYYYEYEKDDFYCYPNSYVLKNKLNITDIDELKQAEREITSLRAAQLVVEPIMGEFDFNHLQRIHAFLFGDIYEWAGKPRNVDISKGNKFCLYQYINEQMSRIFQELREENYLKGLAFEHLAKRLAYYLGEINAIHPFREGNGRTQRIFIEELAGSLGYNIDWYKISKDEMLEASLTTFKKEYGLMETLMKNVLTIK
ncbi:MAG: Fic/DOC family protein [Aminipila sp.]